MSAAAIVLSCLIGCGLGYVVGWMFGCRHGRDCQWCDDYFGSIEKDRSGRDALGRFKKKL
tara:strand:+ start:984 stop:1163 length:180 start_codon:yes stop_codon:yes gene_type:complete